MRPIAERFWEKVDTDGPHHLWTSAVDKDGYGLFQLKAKVLVKAHRLAWEFAEGPIPEDLDVLHHCDIPPCVKRECLFLGTPAENNMDRSRKGRSVNRVTHPELAKLSWQQIYQMRVEFEALGGAGAGSVLRISTIAETYDISFSFAKQILYGYRTFGEL